MWRVNLWGLGGGGGRFEGVMSVLSDFCYMWVIFVEEEVIFGVECVVFC